MALTNNTKFRKKTLTINKRINGSVTTEVGFPKVHNITDAFGAYLAITDSAFETMTDADYNIRLDAFYTYLESLYDFFNREFVLNEANGTNAILCPIDNSTPVQPQVLSYGSGLEPLMGGTKDVNLTWHITLSAVTNIDLYYEFVVLLKDQNGNPIRNEVCFGIIKAGKDSHQSLLDDNLYIYIPEAENVFIFTENVPNNLMIEVIE